MNFIVQGYPAYAYTGGRPFDPALPALVFVHGAALDHSVWHYPARYLAHHGFGVLAVDLPGHGRSPGALRTSIEALTLFSHLANIGDAKSLVIHPASTTHFRMDDTALAAAGITAGTVRLSIGLEHPDDLVEDLSRALRASQK